MQFKWKKLLAASITCMLLTGVSATTMAAYSLSEEVKAPTPALLQASQIGVRTYTTTDPALLAQPDKDAILVMSSVLLSPKQGKTIEATVNEIKAAHPGTKVVLAFTSHIIIDRVKANEGLTVPTPEQALEQLKLKATTALRSLRWM